MLTHSKLVFSLLSVVALALGAVLSGCSAPESNEAVETEIAGFMLDYILSDQIGDASAVVTSIDQPWVEVPPDAMLIVWAPPVENVEEAMAVYLNTDQPLKVWRYVDHRISEAADKTGAIRQYREALIQNSESRSWGYYEFGILSLSRNNSQAEVYLGNSCGPLCGQGLIYTLQRSSSGGWEILETDPRWIS